MDEEVELYDDNIKANRVNEEAIEEAAEEAQKLKTEELFDLDKALDTYDPTFPRYTPSEHALEFFNLMRLVNGKDFDCDTPIAHYFMADLLLGAIEDPMAFPYSEEVCKTITIDKLRIAFMESRGMAKSTVVITFFGVYSAIKGKLPNGIGKVYFYLVVSASSRGGARVNALATRSICEESEFLNSYFESMRFTETESEFVRKGPGKVSERTFLLRYQGIGTGIRGIRSTHGARPCAIINDDVILNEAAAYSKTITANLDSALGSDEEAALKGMGKGRIIHCFTPFHYSDVNTKLVLRGACTPCVIPISKSFNPETIKLSDVQSSWASMHPNKSVYKMITSAKRSNKLKSFMQERMLRLTSSSDRLVPDSCIQWCNVKPIIKNIGMYHVYITTDYTTTSGEGSDFSGIAMWAVSNNRDWFLLDLVLKKMGMKEQYTRTLDMAARMKRLGAYVEIGVEIDGNQAAHVYSLEEEMMKRGDFYTFARDKNNPGSNRKGIVSRSSGVKKHERFRIAVADTLLQKKMWFPEHLKDSDDMKEFVAQIKGATHEGFTRHDDACFTGNTPVWMADGTRKAISEVQAGEEVLTGSSHSAVSKCQASIMTGVKEVEDYYLSDGSKISMTDNHPVYTTEGWILAGDLTSDHTIIKVEEWENKLKHSGLSGHKKEVGTTNQHVVLTGSEDGCINTHGHKKMENSRKGSTSITKTITVLTTWSCFLRRPTQNITKKIAGYLGLRKTEKLIKNSYLKRGKKPMSGTEAKKVDNGIESIEKRSKMLYSQKIRKGSAVGVVPKLCLTSKNEMYTVLESASLKRMKTVIKISTAWFAQFAENVSSSIKRKRLAVRNAIEKCSKDCLVVMTACIEKSKEINLVATAQRSSAISKVLKNTVQKSARLKTMQSGKKKSDDKKLQVEPALSVEEYLNQVEKMQSSVQNNVVGVHIVEKREKRKETVFNLQVEGTHTYFVGSGVLVHNCDLVSQLSLIDVILPSGAVDRANEFQGEDRSSIWGNIEDDEKEVEGFGEVF